MSQKLKSFIFGAIVAATLIGCGGGGHHDSAGSTTITLAANPWSGSRVDAAVAGELLERELHYRVDIVEIDEDTQWPLIAAGDIHASLEVWPSGHAADIATYVDMLGTVENGGDLGVVGKISWYVPTYVAEEHPELSSWEGFAQPDNVALFRTPLTEPKGRFLAGDPSWVQYDAEIIANLGLDFDVVYAGSEASLLEEVERAYAAHEPILFYFWVPHAAHAHLDLTEVALPPYSDACYARAASGGIDCDYPSDVLIKIVWSGLEDYAPQAHRFLHNFQYSTAQQTELLELVDVEGNTPAAAAHEWIEHHPDVWRAWIPD